MQRHLTSGKEILLDFAYEQIPAIGKVDDPVLLHCQRDNVNELVAAAIHDFSARNTKPFFSVECRSREINLIGHKFMQPVKRDLNEVLNLVASGMGDWLKGGSVFLSNFNEMETAEREIIVERLTSVLNCRIIADMYRSKTRAGAGDMATLPDEMVISIPPLRNNQRNIQFFANYFLVKANLEWSRNVTGIAPDAGSKLQAYAWPGDISELRDAIYQCVFIARDGEDLPELTLPTVIREFRNDANSLRKAILTAEHKLIQQALQQSRNNKKKAAAILNISRKTLYSKLRLFEEFAA